MEINMTLHLPRDAATVPVSRQVLDSCLQTLGVTPDTRADIALALSEACASDPVSPFAEHGRGLKIIDAVADNLRLSGDDRQGTIVHFEKTLEWLPGAAGEHLINTDSGR
jgi:serine/threonine-protein kinase RsbW